MLSSRSLLVFISAFSVLLLFVLVDLRSTKFHVQQLENEIAAIQYRQLQRRGVVVFFDGAESSDMVGELAGLRSSLEHVRTPQLPIDLIVFTSLASTRLIPGAWQCLYAVHDADRTRSNCIVVVFEHVNETIIEAVNEYRYLKSLAFFAHEGSRFLNDYDLLLKTDCDTFVTPGFTHWLPRQTEFHVGLGGYSRLQRSHAQTLLWASRLGLQHRGYFNLGASWYASGRAVRAAAILALDVTIHLRRHAFSKGDVWPYWHKGVASMYAQELAVNHLQPGVRPSVMLDYRTNRHGPRNEWRGEMLTVLDVAHLHCYQEDLYFSKAKFALGAYRAIEHRHRDLLDPRHWAFEMALRGAGRSSAPLHITPKQFDRPADNFTELDQLLAPTAPAGTLHARRRRNAVSRR